MAEGFATLLKRHRIAAGLSQETLAERAGVSVDAISALERGARHAPQRATLALLITALSLDADSRHEIESAAQVARGRGPRVQENFAFGEPPDESVLSNLPPQLTSFVDRENEASEIRALLESCRLVTIVGAGGAGKTRCALRVGGDIFDGFNDGVWLADLARISEPALVSTIIVRALGIRELPRRAMIDTLTSYLKRKRLLLILDNCEHVLEEARRVAAAVLHSCKDIRILATSRESFNIAGEQAYRMPSLPVPSSGISESSDEIVRYGAVRLFSDRAMSVNNEFTLTPDNAPLIADICRRLDGIPLAIELAAARIKALSPSELACILDERFRVLTGGDHSALPRHRTMRALIDWSYDLLSVDECALFRKLSIFAGGFALEAAVALCNDGGVEEIVTLDLLTSLVDKSLVQAEGSSGGTRYRLLESTRQYARQKLADCGEYEAAADAHARVFLDLAARFDDAYETTPERAWAARVQPDLENFRVALSWSLCGHGDVLLGQRMACTLRRVWGVFDPAEDRRWLSAAREKVTAETPATTLAALDLAEAQAAGLYNEFGASLAAAERALELCRKLDDRLGILAAEGLIGKAEIYLGEIAKGEALLLRCLETARSLVAPTSVLYALEMLGVARQLADDVPGARQRFTQALESARAVGAEKRAAIIATNLAEAEFRGGNAELAWRLADEAVRFLRASKSFHYAAFAGCNMVAYLLALHRYDEAGAAAREAVMTTREMQNVSTLTFALQHSAAKAALQWSPGVPNIEHLQRAARILGYVDGRLNALRESRYYTEQWVYDTALSALRDTLGADQLSQFMTEGEVWGEEQAVAEALLV